MSEQTRDQLRHSLRTLRSSLSPSQIQQYSHAICENVATLITDAQHIAGYYAFGAEVDLSSLMSGLSQHDKTGYVPVVLADYEMKFAPVNDETIITLNRYGIKEPQVDSALYRTARQLDVVLVPLVGFDPSCNRMGMGGGYYDRCFAHRLQDNSSPLLIGVAYDVQGVANVHAQSWDVPLDYVVTQSKLLRR